MPCDTIVLAEVELGKVDPVHLKTALEEFTKMDATVYSNGDVQFYGGTYRKATGKVELNSRIYSNITETTAAIKQFYSKAVVFSQAKKYNWQIKETAPFQYQVTKR